MEPFAESGDGALSTWLLRPISFQSFRFPPLPGTFSLGYLPDRCTNQTQQMSETSHLLRRVQVFQPQQLLSPAAANLGLDPGRLSSLIQPGVAQAEHLSS